jgi:hypothetical protein
LPVRSFKTDSCPLAYFKCREQQMLVPLSPTRLSEAPGYGLEVHPRIGSALVSHRPTHVGMRIGYLPS